MKQKRKLQQKPTKSRAWLEAKCLKLARRTLGGSEIQFPQPTPLVSGQVRAALAHLTGAYSLEAE
jgi:hypothetical protein